MGSLTVVGLALALSLFIVRSAEGTGTCGERKLATTALIAHGYKARSGAWPWHGAMFHRYRLGRTDYACGVTILTEQFVLTAAHSTYEGMQRLPADRVFIKVGFSNLNSPENRVQQFDVAKIIRHEEFDMDTFENDIALLKLYDEMTFNSYIQSICLWQGDTELSKIISKIGYVVGWGHDEEYSLSERLNEATMPIVSSKKCRESDRWHYYKYYFESKTFCAGRRNDTHISHGDSGGGLYMRMGSNWILRGLVSNAKMNPLTLKVQADSYTIFTDVAYYLNWIKTKVPNIPYFAVDTEKITETEFDSDVNLLGTRNCGNVTYRSRTQEGGKEAVNQYPWEVIIYIKDSTNVTIRNECIVYLIHPSFLIGMVRCFFPHFTNDKIYALFSEFDGIDNVTTTINIHSILIHSYYKDSLNKMANNIAIAKLERPATVEPICLPLLDPLKIFDASQLHMIVLDLHEKSRYFRNVVQLVDLEVCQRQLTKAGVRMNLTAGHACSITNEVPSEFMYLVSAPGQQVKKEFFDGKYFLAAFSSFGFSGAPSEYLAVFTNVVYYSKWIRETIEQEQNQ